MDEALLVLAHDAVDILGYGHGILRRGLLQMGSPVDIRRMDQSLLPLIRIAYGPLVDGDTKMNLPVDFPLCKLPPQPPQILLQHASGKHQSRLQSHLLPLVMDGEHSPVPKPGPYLRDPAALLFRRLPQTTPHLLVQ